MLNPTILLLAGLLGAWSAPAGAHRLAPASGAADAPAAVAVSDTGKKKAPPRKRGEAKPPRKPKASGEPRLERRKPPAVPARRPDTGRADRGRVASWHR